jgi:Mlc titration factor MtfA (ptsG expression regulator)
MFFDWFQRRRRSKLLAEETPSAWWGILRENVKVFERLSSSEQTRLLDFIKVFVADRTWEGCRGFEVNEEVRVTIAAQAGMLILGFDEPYYFDRVSSILVYPEQYMAQGKMQLGGGIVLEGPSAREGETWYRGPVILSWSDVLAGGREEEYGNLVYHEFAHQLDMLNGSYVDGMPPLPDSLSAEQWSMVLNEHYEQLVERCRAGVHGVLDCYGATDKAEFFAVATEAFFMQPRRLSLQHADLYRVLSQWYRQDPRQRENDA